jgi:hypothetical protein
VRRLRACRWARITGITNVELILPYSQNPVVSNLANELRRVSSWSGDANHARPRSLAHHESSQHRRQFPRPLLRPPRQRLSWHATSFVRQATNLRAACVHLNSPRPSRMFVAVCEAEAGFATNSAAKSAVGSIPKCAFQLLPRIARPSLQYADFDPRDTGFAADNAVRSTCPDSGTALVSIGHDAANATLR